MSARTTSGLPSTWLVAEEVSIKQFLFVSSRISKVVMITSDSLLLISSYLRLSDLCDEFEQIWQEVHMQEVYPVGCCLVYVLNKFGYITVSPTYVRVARKTST